MGINNNFIKLNLDLHLLNKMTESDMSNIYQDGFNISINQKIDSLEITKILDSYYGTDEDVIIPDDVDIIGRHAFYCLNDHEMKLWFDKKGEMHIDKNTILRSVRIPPNVKIINGAAFFNCSNLEAIYFGSKNITIVGDSDDKFEDCEPKIIKIQNKDVTLEDLDFLRLLQDRGISLRKLESCSNEIKLLIEANEL